MQNKACNFPLFIYLDRKRPKEMVTHCGWKGN